jgi:MFS family permease
MTNAPPVSSRPSTGWRRFVPALLREQEFRRFWFGQTISVFGDQITYLALPIVAVLLLDADPGQMGLLTAVGLLPHLLFSLPAGVWLDRVRQRRRLMVLADVGRAAAILVVPAAFLGGFLGFELLLVVAFAVGSIAVVFDVAWMTLFTTVARRDQFVEANSLLNGSRSVSAVGGPALAGMLIQVFGAPIALVADGLSFLASAFFLRRIRAADPEIESEPGTLREQLSAGMSFLARDPLMRPSILALATMNLFNFAFQGLFVLFATRNLGVDPGVLGLALGAGAVGGVLGAVLAPAVGRRLGVGGAFVLTMVIFPASAILVPLAEGLPDPAILAMLFAAEFIGGFGVIVLDINGGSIIMARLPDRLRGRASGAWKMINMGVRPIGALLGGALGELIGVHDTLLIVTVAQLGGVLFLVASPVRRLRELPEAPE